MKRLLFLISVLLLCSQGLYAQVSYKYFIGFTDKNNSPYSINNPQQFLSQRSLERRQKNQSALGEQDLPPNPSYIDSLVNYGFTVHYPIRWFNGVVVSTADTTLVLSTVSKPFIREIKDVNRPSSVKRKSTGGEQSIEEEDFIRRKRIASPDASYGKAWEQVSQLGLEKLHSRGLNGHGILIAVLDAGFRSVDTMQAFAHLWQEGRVLLVRDFVGNNLYGSSTHGTNVLSTMAARIDGQFLGTAPGALYMLCRTEDTGSEYPIEEYNWIAAAELADSAGADIINSSLGYHHFDNPVYDYTYPDMDGTKGISSRAATIAASKGIVVVTSAGNLGAQAWKYISVPADADSVIAVGAVNSRGHYAAFSSTGPTFDNRVKPEVVAHGWLTWSVAPNGNIVQGNGTSFASPILAGSIACLMQGLPGATARNTRQAVIESASQFSKPDSFLGYGIPNFPLAYLLLAQADIHSIDSDLDFSVFPNPFDTYFDIAFRSAKKGKFSVRIINASGRSVWESEQQQMVEGLNYFLIETPVNLKKGVYILQLRCNDKTFTRKVVRI